MTKMKKEVIAGPLVASHFQYAVFTFSFSTFSSACDHVPASRDRDSSKLRQMLLMLLFLKRCRSRKGDQLYYTSSPYSKFAYVDNCSNAAQMLERFATAEMSRYIFLLRFHFLNMETFNKITIKVLNVGCDESSPAAVILWERRKRITSPSQKS